MRPIPIINALLLTLMVAAGQHGQAAGPAQALRYDPLFNASYVTAEGIDALLPSGAFTIEQGVIAMFNERGLRREGICIGSISLKLENLDAAAAESITTDTGIAVKEGEIRLRTDAAYICASPASPADVVPSGRVLAIRTWSQLDSAEQKQLKAIYDSCCALSWDDATDGPADGALTDGKPLDDPQGQQIYAVAWLPNGARLDYRVDEEGSSANVSTSVEVAP